MRLPSKFLRASLNPFSQVSGVKVPDGKCALSSGLKLQQRMEIEADTSGIIELILFPGLNNSVIIKGDSDNELNLPFFNHLYVDPATHQQKSNKIAKWRTVACGLSVKLVNNYDDYDGWFESIRINRSAEASFPTTTASDGNEMPGISAQGDALPEVVQDATNLVEHPTYKSGSLRDMEQFLFKLHPSGKDRDFRELPDVMSGYDFIDKSHDMVYIKIYGRAKTTESVGTRLLLYCVHHQEIMYDESTNLSRFHSPTYTNMSDIWKVRKHSQAAPRSAIAHNVPTTVFRKRSRYGNRY